MLHRRTQLQYSIKRHKMQLTIPHCAYHIMSGVRHSMTFEAHTVKPRRRIHGTVFLLHGRLARRRNYTHTRRVLSPLHAAIMVVHSLAHIQWNLHLDAVGMRPPPTRHTLTTLRGRRRHRKRTTARVQRVLKKFYARAGRQRCRYVDRQRYDGFGHRRRLVLCHVAKKTAPGAATWRWQRS